MNITPAEMRTVEKALREYALLHDMVFSKSGVSDLANRFREAVNDQTVEVSFGDMDTQMFEAYKTFVMEKASEATREGTITTEFGGYAIPPGTSMLLTAALGLSGEVGEFVDHIKKFLFHGHKIDHEYIKLELGDIFWYAALLMNQEMLSLRQVIDANRDKLNKRYKSALTTEESVNRAEGSPESIHQPSLVEGVLDPQPFEQPTLEGDEQVYGRCQSISQPGLAGKQCDREEGHSGLHISEDQSWTRPFPAPSNLEPLKEVCNLCESAHEKGTPHNMARISYPK